jgi:hypothetical protein
VRSDSVQRPVSMGRVLVLGAIAAAVALLANVIWSLASASSTLLRWWAIPIAGVLGAVVGAVDQLRQPAAESDADTAHHVMLAPRRPSRWHRLADRLWRPGRRTLAGALVVGVAIFAIGGAVTAAAGRYAMNWLTGHESGQDRLARDAHHTVSGIGVTVTALVQTPHFTRVTIDVDNETGSPITLPIDQDNAVLVSGDGTRCHAKLVGSEWTESIATGQIEHGVITFAGHLPSSASRARLTFVHIFSSSATAPTSVTITGLRLRPPG